MAGHAQYCVVAALLFMLIPGDLTYVCVTGLFLAMKVTCAKLVRQKRGKGAIFY
jgi:hypothetical protein